MYIHSIQHQCWDIGPNSAVPIDMGPNSVAKPICQVTLESYKDLMSITFMTSSSLSLLFKALARGLVVKPLLLPPSPGRAQLSGM